MRVSAPTLFMATALGLLALSGCQGETKTANAQQGAGGAPPPSPVGIVEVRPEPIAVTSELPGRIAPTRIAEVRPRVGGIIVQRVFEQGSDVDEGDPLFQIDPATFQVAVESAQAGVAKADAVLTQARQDAERTQALVARNTVGTANLETAVATQRQAEADLASARAQLRAAQINLDYATVRAPISGRIGRALITEGALVSTTGTEALATIQQLDPVYADIQQPVSQLLRLREALRTGQLTQLEENVAQVRLKLDDGSEYPYPGRLLFSESTVEETSGQVTLRAEFPNPDDTLLPGLYVRVAVDQGIDAKALAVPNQAVQRDTSGQAFLYLVNANNTVEQRTVTVVRVVGNRSVISQGLAAGDKVIADGFQKIGPGAPVAPTPWTPVGAAAEGLSKDAGKTDATGAGAQAPASTPAGQAASPEAQRATPAPGSDAAAAGTANSASQDADGQRATAPAADASTTAR
ncbi:efflux RND transporter periplasmic adaptor subunit [Aureimonas sp. AU40]|uniref:efflux RND transporter periplasmic adaptor subunit n=1 Tax=Aureimonas sp. AU40 TaxID=1637747 RepID=UPI000781E808|nr:efflux RND transporter periplasmic adaptor subunit [Aureimonas sp. AU40]